MVGDGLRSTDITSAPDKTPDKAWAKTTNTPPTPRLPSVRRLIRPLATSRFNMIQCPRDPLRQFHAQLVYLLRAAVTHKHPGTIRGPAAPGAHRTGVAFNRSQHKRKFGLILLELHPANRLSAIHQIVEINRFAVRGPHWIAHRPGCLDQPVRPPLGFEVIPL